MNAEISLIQRQVLELFQKQRAYLAGKPRQFILDLQHEAEELRCSPDFTVRTAAEINYTACLLILEAAQPTTPPIKPS